MVSWPVPGQERTRWDWSPTKGSGRRSTQKCLLWGGRESQRSPSGPLQPVLPPTTLLSPPTRVGEHLVSWLQKDCHKWVRKHAGSLSSPPRTIIPFQMFGTPSRTYSSRSCKSLDFIKSGRTRVRTGDTFPLRQVCESPKILIFLVKIDNLKSGS